MPTCASVSVIIPTYTNDQGLFSLLGRLGAYPLVIIDNKPSRVKRKACASLPNCLYLPQTSNLGFARAINLALPHVHTTWTCLLNDDIELPTKLPFKELIEFAQKHKFTAVSPVLIKPDGQIENLGYQVSPIGRVELVKSGSSLPLDGLTAACLIIRSKVLLNMRGFDERFFAYLEDVDLFLRLKASGYRFGIDQDTKVIHRHQTTSSHMGNFKAKMDLKNWLFLILKHWPLPLALRHLPGICLERLRNISGLFKATWREFTWRSLYYFPRDLAWVAKEVVKFIVKDKSYVHR